MTFPQKAISWSTAALNTVLLFVSLLYDVLIRCIARLTSRSQLDKQKLVDKRLYQYAFLLITEGFGMGLSGRVCRCMRVGTLGM
jgi:hypothetical protein